MGSPETCPTCGSAVRFSTEIACASGAWTDPWHHATPTPPGAAPDAASGPKAPPRMPAPAEVCAFCGITTTDAEPSDGTKYVCRDTQPCINRARKACGLPPKPAPAPDAGAAEDHTSEASRDHGAEGSDRAVVEGFAWDVGVEVLRERHSYIPDAAAGLTLPSDRYILEAAIARVMAREKYAALRGTKGA